MKPEETLKVMEKYLSQLEAATKTKVKVGLPSDKVGSQVYGDGVTIMQIGAQHEYGTLKMQARSFLRMPFELKRDKIRAYIDARFADVFSGKINSFDALEKVGIYITNISKEAFRTNGFGQWVALDEETKRIKKANKKTTPLVWTSTLRNSVTWSVEQ